MRDLTTLLEAEQELEIQELRRRVAELSWQVGAFPVRFSANPAEIVQISADQPPTLRAVATLDSRHTDHFGLEIIGETSGPPHEQRYRSAYYVSRTGLYGFRNGTQMLANLHDRFVKQLAKGLYGK